MPAQRLGSITASAADSQGNIYVYHRPKKDTLQDPIAVIDSKGSVLRTFGKGPDPMPHGIEIDPAGNLWTVDAHTSMVRKLTPQGETLDAYEGDARVFAKSWKVSIPRDNV